LRRGIGENARCNPDRTLVAHKVYCAEYKTVYSGQWTQAFEEQGREFWRRWFVCTSHEDAIGYVPRHIGAYRS